MSRSVRSRRSLGASSARSINTTVPRFPSGISITSHVTERKSQLSLIQRSVPTAFTVRAVTPDKKAKQILENLGKRITKLNLTSDQQFNFSLKLNNLHEETNKPEKFWDDWIALKESIISTVREQSNKPRDFEALKEFYESSFDQFSIGLGDVSEKLPSRFEASKKATEIQIKFTELNQMFKKLCDKCRTLETVVEASEPAQIDIQSFNSVISSFQSFRQILVTEYKSIFSSLRDPNQKKKIDETERNPLLSVQKQNQMVRNLSSILEYVEFRLSEYVDPSSAIPNIKDILQSFETNLRKTIMNFPEEQRKQNYQEQAALESKEKSYRQFENKCSQLKKRRDQLQNKMYILNANKNEIIDQIDKEKKSWNAEKKKYQKILKKEEFENLIKDTQNSLDKVKAENAQLQDDINVREHNLNDHTKIQSGSQKVLNDLENSKKGLLELRAKNFTLIELLGDDQKAYKENLPKFLDKWKAKVDLDMENQLDFQLKRMNDKRSNIHSYTGKMPTDEDFMGQISRNKDDFKEIKNEMQKISKLQKKIFIRKLKKLINNSASIELVRIREKNDFVDRATDEESEFGKLKQQAELLETEFKLNVLENSQQKVDDENAIENEINELKNLNKKINQNGNQIRLNFLKIQSYNKAMKFAINAKIDYSVNTKTKSPISNERLNKEHSLNKYKEECQMQEKEVIDICKMLNIAVPAAGTNLDTVFTSIYEKVKVLVNELNNDDLDARINDLRHNISIYNRNKRQDEKLSQKDNLSDNA